MPTQSSSAQHGQTRIDYKPEYHQKILTQTSLNNVLKPHSSRTKIWKGHWSNQMALQGIHNVLHGF